MDEFLKSPLGLQICLFILGGYIGAFLVGAYKIITTGYLVIPKHVRDEMNENRDQNDSQSQDGPNS